MKKLLFTILIFILVCPAAFTQSINADTLLLIDTNAVAKGKLYYLRVSGDTLFINSDTIVSGGVGDSFWYLKSTDTIGANYHIVSDSSFVSLWNGSYFGNDGSISGFDTSAYLVTADNETSKSAFAMAAFQLGIPTVQMTAYNGDQGSQVYLEPGYMLIATDSLLMSGLLEGDAIYGLGQDADGQIVLTEVGGGTNHWTLNGNYLYPTDTIDSIAIGTDIPTEQLQVDGFVKFYNSDSGYTKIYLSDTTTDLIVSYRANGMYINNLGGVRLNGGCIDSLRFSTVWAEGESVGINANFSSTSYGGIFFNGGYETSWFVHEGSTYGCVSVDTSSFNCDIDHSSNPLNLGESDNPWVITYTDFLRLTPQADPPSPATAGMIYSDTDGHIYHYDGSNWDQLDN